MSAFDIEDGLIHFLFADDDDYYLDSLMCLDLDHYLFYLLKNRNYENIVFLKENDPLKNNMGNSGQKEIAAYCLDSASAETYTENAQGMFWQSKPEMKEEKDRFGNVFSIKWKRDAAVSRIQKLLTAERSAVIIPISVFGSVSRSGDFISNLEQIHRNHANKGILILSASNTENGLFDKIREISETSEILFGEIRQILSQNVKLDFYRQMHIKYRDRMQVFNQDKIKDQEKLIKRMLVAGTFKGSPDNITEYSTVISSVPRNIYIQSELNDIFDVRRIRSARSIKNDIGRMRNMKKLDSMIENKALYSLCEKNADPGKQNAVIYPGKTVPPEFYELIRTYKQNKADGINWSKQTNRLLERIWTGLKTQWNYEYDRDEVTEKINQCISFLNEYTQIHKSNQDELEYSPAAAALNCIDYLVNDSKSIKLNHENREKVIGSYKNLILIAKNVTEDIGKYQVNIEKINELSDKMAAAGARIAELNNSIKKEMDIGSPLIESEKLKIKSIEDEYKNLESSIKNLKNINIIIGKSIKENKEVINNFNTFSFDTSEKEIDSIMDSMRTVAENVEQKVIHSMKAAEEAKHFNSHIEDMFEESGDEIMADF